MGGKIPSLTDLRRMEYLDWCVKEGQLKEKHADQLSLLYLVLADKKGESNQPSASSYRSHSTRAAPCATPSSPAAGGLMLGQ